MAVNQVLGELGVADNDADGLQQDRSGYGPGLAKRYTTEYENSIVVSAKTGRGLMRSWRNLASS